MKAGWEAAAKLIEKGQVAQKEYYDQRFAKDHKFKEGERVFLFDPSCKQLKPGKLAAPFEGLFEIISISEPNVHLRSHQGQEFTAHIFNLSKPTKEYLESGQTVHSTRKRPYREDLLQHKVQNQPNTVTKQTDKDSAVSEPSRARSRSLEQKKEAVPDSPSAPKKSEKQPIKPALVKRQPQTQQSILKRPDRTMGKAPVVSSNDANKTDERISSRTRSRTNTKEHSVKCVTVLLGELHRWSFDIRRFSLSVCTLNFLVDWPLTC